MESAAAAAPPPAMARGTPARSAGARGGLSWLHLAAFVVMAAPQIVFAVPGAPEQLKSTDLLGFGCLLLYALIRARRPLVGRRDEALLLAFMAWNMVAAFVGFLVMTATGIATLGELIVQFGRQIRFALIYAPALLAFVLPLDQRGFARIGTLAMLVAVAMTLYVTLQYRNGDADYFAHQSLIDETGRYIKRLGGLTGETGAFSFNALVTYQLLAFFLALGGRRLMAQAALLAYPLFVGVVFYFAQARIGLAIGALFFLLAIGMSGLFSRRALLLIALGAAAAIALAVWRVDPANSRLLLRLAGLWSGEIADVTSGRLEHWGEALDLWILNPFFGYGHGNSILILGHSVENLALQALVDYGLIGAALLGLLLIRIGGPLFSRSGAHGTANMLLAATAATTLLQWQVNDINTYNQTFPILAMVVVMQRRLLLAERAAAGPEGGGGLST
jgi:O-antigen ligase